MRTLNYMICIVLCSVSLTSFAKDDIKCNEAGTQQELEACARDDFSKADKELNKIYQAILKREKNDPLFVSKLRIAQKAWLAFIEADLDAQFACPKEESKLVCWGSMYPMSYLSRRAELTRERTKHLQRILKEGHGQ